MSDEQKYTIQGLDEYIRQGEPQQRERSEAWKEAYEYDPLYELVRQTLLVENIIWCNDTSLPVDDYLHINVIPYGNEELRKEISNYAQGLKDVSKFIVIDPKQLMTPIKDTNSDLYNYLDARYWQ